MQRFISQECTRGRDKIAFVMTHLLCGGAENALKALLDRLDRNMFSPVVICMDALGDIGLDLLGQRCTTMYWDVGKSPIAPRRYFDLVRILRTESVDLLCDAITQAQTQALSVVATLALGIPLISWVHHTKRMRTRLHQELISRVCLPRYNRVIAVGSAQCTWLCRDYALVPERITVVHNGISLEPFVNLPDTIQAKRALGIEPRRPVIGITAQLRPEKDHETLLAAMRLVVHRFPEALLVLVGDGQRRKYLHDLARSYGLSQNVLFLGQRRDISNIVAAYDVGVLSSGPWVETLPLAVLEYMAAGKPTVATDVGSVSDLVSVEETGFLVRPQAPDAFATKILTILGDRDLAVRMGATAAKIVRQRFSAEAMALRMQSVFGEVLGKHPDRLAIHAEVPSASHN
jgi:glycosyltransferase involved in cell wall biosynthesis